MNRAAAVLFTLLTAVTASAQRPIFDPDDFLDQRATGGSPVLISRIVIGAASNMSGDGFRPLGDRIGYVHLANSFYWRGMQFDYKRSEMRAEDGEAAQWEPVYLDSGQRTEYRRTRSATPKSKDTLHAAWYWPVAGGDGIPVMLRTRVTYTTQRIDTAFVFGTQVTPVSSHAYFNDTNVSSRERTFALDTDTWFRIAGHDVFGSLAYSETKTSGALTNPNELANRDERALTYTNRFPSMSLDKAKILIRPTLTVGGISNRGGSAVNLVNPAIEIFRPFAHSRANLHVIWSPQWAVSDKEWKTTHQVAVLIDVPVFVKMF